MAMFITLVRNLLDKIYNVLHPANDNIYGCPPEIPVKNIFEIPVEENLSETSICISKAKASGKHCLSQSRANELDNSSQQSLIENEEMGKSGVMMTRKTRSGTVYFTYRM